DAMEWVGFAVAGAAVIGFAIVAQSRGWIDLTSRRNGRTASGSVLVGPIDEVFAPSRQEAQAAWEAQQELPAPAPTPGDPDKDVYRGNVRIHLDDLDERDGPERQDRREPRSRR